MAGKSFDFDETLAADNESLIQRGFKDDRGPLRRITISLYEDDLKIVDEMRRSDPDVPNRSKMIQKILRRQK
jgi:hypothetical protein